MTPTPGLCGCGCGGRTKIATRTSTRNEWIKGQPLHYLRDHGNYLTRGPRWIEGPVPVDRPELGPCWIWQRSFNEQGYPVGNFTKYGKKHGLAHRALFEINVGPIPDDMELDHLCYVPACVRWVALGLPTGHFEVVTPEENLRRRRTTKLHNPELALALMLRGKGLSWRAVAAELGVTHPPLLGRLRKYCEVNGLEFPASESTRPAHLIPVERPPARRCLSCRCACYWSGEVWVCNRCGSVFTAEQGPQFAPLNLMEGIPNA